MIIVFLLADDVRWNSIGCFGNNIVYTPHIDRLAEEGVRFENAYVTTPNLCGQPGIDINRSVHEPAWD